VTIFKYKYDNDGNSTFYIFGDNYILDEVGFGDFFQILVSENRLIRSSLKVGKSLAMPNLQPSIIPMWNRRGVIDGVFDA
jgi:hypothetical protein